MTVEVLSSDLRYSGKPGRSFRKSKEDLALFESINDLPDSSDLDSCLADIEPDSLAADQLLKKDISDSDAGKNDDDWLVPTPEASVSLQPHPSNLIVSRNLSAIKTTRSATSLEPARVCSTPQRNPSPRVYKGPQELKISPSKIPRFNASISASSTIPTVRKSSPAPTRIPRAASSPRASAPSAIPRASSPFRASAPSAIPRTSSSPRVSTPSVISRASSSPRTTLSSGIRPPSPKSKWSSSTKTTPAPSQTPKSARGSSPRVISRAYPTSASTKGREPSHGFITARTSSSPARLPGSQPGSARSVRSSASSSHKKEPVSAAKASFLAHNDFLSETPSNLRTDPFTKRAGSLHARSLSRSYDGPIRGDDSSSTFQDYVANQNPSDLSRSQDRGAFQHLASSKPSTSSDAGSHFIPTKTPAFGGGPGVGRRILTTNEDDDPPQTRSGPDAVTRLNRFGYGKVDGSTVKRLQMGFTLKREDIVVADHQVQLPCSSSSSPPTTSALIIDTKAATSSMEMAIPHLSTTAMISQVDDQGQVKVYQGLGDMEDMEDRGGNWCCGMADRYRGLCKQRECVIFNNFHTALVLKSPDPTPPCQDSESDAEEEEKEKEKEEKEKEEREKEEREKEEREKEEREKEEKEVFGTGSGHSEELVKPKTIEEFLQQFDLGASDCVEAAGVAAFASSSGLEMDECKQAGAELEVWKMKAREENVSKPSRRSKLEKGESVGKRREEKSGSYSKWEVEVTDHTCSRPRPLGKPPDFFDVTKRNVEDGGIVAAISSVKSVSGDESEHQFRVTAHLFPSPDHHQPLHRSASMNGSHVSHSDEENEEALSGLPMSDSDSDVAKSIDGASAAQSDESSSSHRELMSQLSRASSTKSNARRFFCTSAISIDLTRSIDTTCSTQSPCEYNIWEEPPSDSNRYGSDPNSLSLHQVDPPSSAQPISSLEELPPPAQASTSVYDYGLEKLAGYIRSASANARRRRASVTSSESDSKTSCLSRESSFDYFVDFFEAQTNQDPEARAVADLLVSAHVEAKRIEYSDQARSSSSSGSTGASALKRMSDEAAGWPESNKSVQTLEEKRNEGAEQIVESSATLTGGGGLDKHFSSFKFGQKKYPAGEFESITTLEVVPESPPRSDHRHSARFNDKLPSPLCQKFLKEIEEQQNLCEGVALGALKSAPMESVVGVPVELHGPYFPKDEEEEDDVLHAPPASPRCTQLPINCQSSSAVSSSSAHGSPDSCSEPVAATVQATTSAEGEVEAVEKGKELDQKKGKKEEIINKGEDEEQDSEMEIEKVVVEQVLRPPVPKLMTKTPGNEMPVTVITATTSPTKRAAEQAADTNNDKTCGCTIL